MRAAVRATGRAGTERLVHDPPDGGGAAPALRAATEATVDLTRSARGGSAGNRGTHRVVTEHVTRADDHCSRRGTETRQIRIDKAPARQKQREKHTLQRF